MRRLPYYSSCVDWPSESVDELTNMIDQAREITRRTFTKNVDPDVFKLLREGLGYASHPAHGVTMNQDYHVRYYASSIRGRPAYFVTHSAIEYVFSNVARH